MNEKLKAEIRYQLVQFYQMIHLEKDLTENLIKKNGNHLIIAIMRNEVSQYVIGNEVITGYSVPVAEYIDPDMKDDHVKLILLLKNRINSKCQFIELEYDIIDIEQQKIENKSCKFLDFNKMKNERKNIIAI